MTPQEAAMKLQEFINQNGIVLSMKIETKSIEDGGVIITPVLSVNCIPKSVNQET